MRKTVIETPHGVVKLWRTNTADCTVEGITGDPFPFVTHNNAAARIAPKFRAFYDACLRLPTSAACVKAAKTYDWSKDPMMTEAKAPEAEKIDIVTEDGTVTLKNESSLESYSFALTGPFLMQNGTCWLPDSDEFWEKDQFPKAIYPLIVALNRAARSKDWADVAKVAREWGVVEETKTKPETEVTVETPFGKVTLTRNPSGVEYKVHTRGLTRSGEIWGLPDVATEDDFVKGMYPFVRAISDAAKVSFDECVKVARAFRFASPTLIAVGDFVRFDPKNNITAATFFGVSLQPIMEGEVTRVHRPTKEGLLCVDIDKTLTVPVLCVARAEPKKFEITKYRGSRKTVISRFLDYAPDKSRPWSFGSLAGPWFTSAEEAIKASSRSK